MIRSIWAASKPLTITVFLMAIDALVCIVELCADHRVLTGAPIWNKPLQFAISVGIFSFTMAIAFQYLSSKTARVITGSALALSSWIEIVLIDWQAVRGTTSHFNVSTSFDAGVFLAMAIAIVVLLLSLIVVTIAFFRQKHGHATFLYAWRGALLVTTVGAGLAGLMTRPTPDQLQQLQRGEKSKTIGAHTVGAPDGGPGLPVVNWSKEHGDIRVAHFVGLHALQIIPAFAWLFARSRRYSVKQRNQFVVVVSAGYAAVIAILLWQALRGESVIHPNAATLVAWGALAVTITAAVLAVVRVPSSSGRVNGLQAEVAR